MLVIPRESIVNAHYGHAGWSIRVFVGMRILLSPSFYANFAPIPERKMGKVMRFDFVPSRCARFAHRNGFLRLSFFAVCILRAAFDLYLTLGSYIFRIIVATGICK